jgi:hypothetical protein
MLVWTIACFLGTWMVIFRYGILFKGLISIMVTFFFGAFIWVIPFVFFLISDLFLAPPGEPSSVQKTSSFTIERARAHESSVDGLQ